MVFDDPSKVIDEDPTVRTPTTLASPATLKSLPTNTLSCVVVTPTNVDNPEILTLSSSV